MTSKDQRPGTKDRFAQLTGEFRREDVVAVMPLLLMMVPRDELEEGPQAFLEEFEKSVGLAEAKTADEYFQRFLRYLEVAVDPRLIQELRSLCKSKADRLGNQHAGESARLLGRALDRVAPRPNEARPDGTVRGGLALAAASLLDP